MDGACCIQRYQTLCHRFKIIIYPKNILSKIWYLKLYIWNWIDVMGLESNPKMHQNECFDQMICVMVIKGSCFYIFSTLKFPVKSFKFFSYFRYPIHYHLTSSILYAKQKCQTSLELHFENWNIAIQCMQFQWCK